MKRKIVFAGGGSAYFESVICEICLTPELAGCRVVLYDVDRKRMGVIRNAGRRIIDKARAGITLTATTDLPRALDGADFVISSIGVHGPGARWHKSDSDVCARSTSERCRRNLRGGVSRRSTPTNSRSPRQRRAAGRRPSRPSPATR